jgi:cysteine synthase
MAKIDLTIQPETLKNTIRLARERAIIIPTFSQMKEPSTSSDMVKKELSSIGLWDVNPRNLFRVTWKNVPITSGGGFGGVNYFELPRELTGVEARILVLVGKWFPTGAHKVGASFGCLVPRLVTGQFDPENQKAVWPSTGNFCRGGAYNSALLGCKSIAILPEGMSQERFEWLKTVAGEIIATPGSESNVKEIYDKCWELRASGQNLMIFNQFEEFGNYLWHYEVTGNAMREVIEREIRPGGEFRAMTVTTGSAGTIACGDYLKQKFPAMKIGVGEALQCPTLLENGFGAHRIEGIGDKHVPWIHNIKNTDFISAIDDEAVVGLARLFNEPAGRSYLVNQNIPEDIVLKLDLIGFSGIANMLSAIKMAKYYEMGSEDIIITVLTDSMQLYQSRLVEMRNELGEYSKTEAAAHYARFIQGEDTAHTLELTYEARRRVHNLKYYTWVEQQGRTFEELNSQWYDRDYWTDLQAQIPEIDALIVEFNSQVGLMK